MKPRSINMSCRLLSALFFVWAACALPTTNAAEAPTNAMATSVKQTGISWPVPIDQSFSDADWHSMGGVQGANGDVFAIAVASNGALYVAGDFTVIGNVAANHIAKWNGSTWTNLGSGLDGYVNALAVDGFGNLYAGGLFTVAGGIAARNIAKWNGGTWTNLGAGTSGPAHDYSQPYVLALAVDGFGNLYAGGEFTTAGVVRVNHIAKWNGSTWSALGAGMSGWVLALAADGAGNLYAGGTFDTAGGIAAKNIAKWNGSTWSALGTGIDSDYSSFSSVFALALTGATVYAGGDFNTAGGIAAKNIAKWNGSTWSALGAGISHAYEGSALALDGMGNLYAGGYFDTAGGIAANNIAKWNGSVWSNLGAGIGGNDNGGSVAALAVVGVGTVYAGGSFSSAGGIAAKNIAKWNGSTWSSLGLGMNGDVAALAVGNAGNLYAGGYFRSAGGIAANYIAKWNGNSWTNLGAGVSGGDPDYWVTCVAALAVDGTSTVYAGGYFTTAGVVRANYIAKWNGSTWSALGAGVNEPNNELPSVSALAMDGAGSLYAGGCFTTAGVVRADCVAKWNGSTWANLGTGIDGGHGYSYPWVSALAVYRTNNLYVGGYFTSAGGVTATNIAQWNGSTWSSLGAGLNESVQALAVDGAGNLYAGGYFTSAGGIAATNIAKWNGSTWAALGAGCEEGVTALAMDGAGNLYAGGWFTTAGVVRVNSIAKWNGSTWSNLGSGMSGGYYGTCVNALAMDDADRFLYAGGGFSIAGGKVSAYAAYYDIVPEPALAMFALLPLALLWRRKNATNHLRNAQEQTTRVASIFLPDIYKPEPFSIM